MLLDPKIDALPLFFLGIFGVLDDLNVLQMIEQI